MGGGQLARGEESGEEEVLVEGEHKGSCGGKERDQVEGGQAGTEGRGLCEGSHRKCSEIRVLRLKSDVVC